MEGFIFLHRHVTENEFWFSEKFTKAQAWIDLLLLASHKERTLYIRGIEINLKPGELCYSQQSLAERWHWNFKTVSKYLKLLKEKEMIEYKGGKLTTIISIINWKKYQFNGGQNQLVNKGVYPLSGNIDGEQNGEQKENRMETNNNVYNVNKYKESKPLKKRESFTIQSLPTDLNGQLYYKNSFFYVTQAFKAELCDNMPGLTEDRLKTEFYRMEQWLSAHGSKKDYKRFLVNWLSKIQFPQTMQNTFSFNPIETN